MPNKPRAPKTLPKAETMTPSEVAAKLHISRGTVSNLVKRSSANFPKRINTGLRTVLYRSDEIDLYSKHGAAWRVMRDLR